jgi:acyl-coenzyme A synthetase/AMP-(fatty) acid ligase
MMNNAHLEWLIERFQRNKPKTFLVWRDREFSYGWLLDQIEAWDRTLEKYEVTPGTIVALEGDYSPRVIALLISLIRKAAIIVPLTESVRSQRAEFRRIAEVQMVITFSEADGAGFERVQRNVESSLLRKLIDLGEPGLVLFSSGSTGKSKAALHSFTSLLQKFRTERYSLVTLAFLMLDHIGGINTLLYVLSNTGTVVAVETRDPDLVCSAIERYRVELLPTSPTFLNLLLISESYKRHDLSSLKRITYGTEVMPERTLHRIREILPGVELQQTYGLSEIGIMRSKSQNSDSLWVKLGGEDFETKVCNGTLWVKARSAMLGYLNAPSPFDEEGWFDTSDAVEVNGEYMRILGRKSEIINVGGEKVYPAEVESILLELPNVEDVTVAGEPNPITGQTVVARFNVIERENPAEFRKRVREFCRGKLANYKIPAKIEIVDAHQYSLRYKKMRSPSSQERLDAPAPEET